MNQEMLICLDLWGTQLEFGRLQREDRTLVRQNPKDYGTPHSGSADFGRLVLAMRSSSISYAIDGEQYILVPSGSGSYAAVPDAGVITRTGKRSSSFDVDCLQASEVGAGRSGGRRTRQSPRPFWGVVGVMRGFVFVMMAAAGTLDGRVPFQRTGSLISRIRKRLQRVTNSFGESSVPIATDRTEKAASNLCDASLTPRASSSPSPMGGRTGARACPRGAA